MYEIGFIVVAVVSDLGPSNRKIHKELNLSRTNSSFQHPSNQDLLVLVYADVPHMIKLCRNHLIDHGFKLADGRIVDRKPLDMIIAKQTGDCKPGWKLQDALLNLNSNERQCVKFATKLLSRNTARTLMWASENSMLNVCESNGKTLSNFIELADAWFGLQNSSGLNSLCWSKCLWHRSAKTKYDIELHVRNY